MSGEQWRIDNNGTGDMLSIYEGDRVVADVYDDTEGLAIVKAHNQAELLERYRAALIRYGAHTGNCGYYPHQKANPKTGYTCLCGLYDLVDEGEFVAALHGEQADGEGEG